MSKATLIKISESKMAARKMASQISATELDSVISNLKAARDFLAKQATNRAVAQREQKIKKAMSMLKKLGLNPEDLARSSGVPRNSKKNSTSRNKVSAKYRITVNGVVSEWSGRGRMPVVFRDAMERNGDLLRYVIK